MTRKALVLALFLWFACARPPTLPSAPADTATVEVMTRTMTVGEIQTELWGAGRTSTFGRSSLAERRVVSEILAVLLDRARTEDRIDANAELSTLAARAIRVGMRLEVWHVVGGEFLALLEDPAHLRGAGAYVVRVAPRAPARLEVVLQAPHAYYDTGTGDIAARLFFQEGATPRALFTNTVHRYWDADGTRSPRDDSPADVCHRTDHVFQYATDAAARILGDIAVIQLHGFADGPGRPDAVISAGDASGSTPLVRAVVRALGDQLGQTARFPEDTAELGGTTNAQGRMLRTYPRAHFVHIEMSKSTRRRMRSSADELDRLARALFGEAMNLSSEGAPSP